MWNRCYVRYRRNRQAGWVQGPQRTLPARPRTLDEYLDLTHIKLAHGLPGRCRCRKLGRKRRTLATPFESGRARTGPTQNSPIGIRDRDDRIVKCCADVYLTARDVFPLTSGRPTTSATLRSSHRFSLACCSCAKNVKAYIGCYLRARFFPATVFFTPRRVRALVRVRWPRLGRLRRWRRPR